VRRRIPVAPPYDLISRRAINAVTMVLVPNLQRRDAVRMEYKLPALRKQFL
jgi:hypothetical protein